MSKGGPIGVFVVFAGPDRDRAATLCHALRETGLRVFSEHDLRPGDKWDVVLPIRLRAALAVVVLISERWAGDNHYAPEEVAIAIDHARQVEPPARLIPVWLDGALDHTPYGLRRHCGVHITGDAYAAAAVEIAASLGSTDAEPQPRPRDAVEATRDRLDNLRLDGARPETLDRALADHLNARRAARDGSPPRAGDVFADRYRLIDRLGDGGFATVWLAHDLRCDNQVALKILHGRWRHDRSRVERFERGAKRMAALDHPAVARVLDAPATYDGWPYYVMEYLPGGDLAAARTRIDRPLSAEQALAAVLTAADALSAVHRLGMVHRDIKPQNILLDTEGRAKLSDFDLIGAKDSTGGTRTGALGTFLFAAPEALAAAKDATPAADVYGLAVTTVFALLGRVPPAVVRQPETVIDALNAPKTLCALLRRSLAWDPSERPANAEEYAATLRAALTSPEPTPKPIPRPHSTAQAAPDNPNPPTPTRFTPPQRGPSLQTSLRPAHVAVTIILVTVTTLVSLLVFVLTLATMATWLGATGGVHEPFRAASNRAGTGIGEPWRDPMKRTNQGILAPSEGDGAAGFSGTDREQPASSGHWATALWQLPGFVRVPAGTYMMGSPETEEERDSDEGPRHLVRLTQPLWVAAHEVTQEEWSKVMGTSPSHFANCARCPVDSVSWYEAAEFTNRLSQAEGLTMCYFLTGCDSIEQESDRLPGDGIAAEFEFRSNWQCQSGDFVGVQCDGYRLPTEGEWEYFTRADTDSRYALGNTEASLTRLGWHDGNSGGRTHPVGGKEPNLWGIYDVHGNVWEWTNDFFGAYSEKHNIDPTGYPTGAVLVFRGGSWRFPARGARSAFRYWRHPGSRARDLGFRIVRTLSTEP